MENVEQSESTLKFSLKCSHPYASFESGACDNGWNYNLKSNVHSHNTHIISRRAVCDNGQFVLNHSTFKITLKQWLKKRKNGNNWDDEYLKWKVYRPKEEARQIIRGILHAVCELHSNDCCHGFLYHLENFAIQDKALVIGDDGKHVFLIHENHELKDSSSVSTNDNTQLGDRLAVSNVIFDQILGATASKESKECWYPQDLKKLRELLEQTNVNSHDWKLIVDHPSLWHWKLRFSYIERVQTHYVNAKPNSPTFNRMKIGFNKITVLGWTQNIPIDSPLEGVYKFKGNGYDGKKAEHLLRYLRNVRAHYKERMDKAWPPYDKKFSNPQFIELKITEVSELFLLDLYSMMCQNEIVV